MNEAVEVALTALNDAKSKLFFTVLTIEINIQKAQIISLSNEVTELNPG